MAKAGLNYIYLQECQYGSVEEIKKRSHCCPAEVKGTPDGNGWGKQLNDIYRAMISLSQVETA